MLRLKLVKTGTRWLQKKFKGLDKIDIESNVLLEITAKTLTVDWQSNIKLTSLCLD